MQETDAAGVIREELDAPPSLTDGETIELNARYGIPITIVVISVIITFIPPFVWGPALYLIFRHSKKRDGLWVTNKRIVDFSRPFFSKKYQVSSIPIGRINGIDHKRGGGTSLIDRLFGVGDVQVLLKAGFMSRYHIGAIKSPGKLIGCVRKAVRSQPT